MSIISSVEFVDAHCHVDLYQEPSKILADAEKNKVWTLAVTNLPRVFSHTKDLASRYKVVFPAVGFHPELVGQYESEFRTIDEFIANNNYIGEIGLDYVTTDSRIQEKQRRVFSHIVNLCRQSSGRVLSIHSRRSAQDVLEIIGSDFPGSVILHWFSGNHRDLNNAVKLGCYFSCNPAMLLSETGRKLVSLIPRNRVLTESDGPFVTIQGQPAGPGMMPKVIGMIAELWNEEFKTVQKTILNNLTTCLSRSVVL